MLSKKIFFSFAANYQNGTISDKFTSDLDVCIATDTEKCSPALLTICNNNVYDGYVSTDYPTNLKTTFIGIRKKGTKEVSKQ